MNRAARAIAIAAGIVVVGAAGWLALRSASPAECGKGFSRAGARCCTSTAGCDAEPDACPSPLAKTEHGCDAPPTRVRIAESELLVGPSDWEAEGRVPPRKIHVRAFSIDAFEATWGSWACPACPFPDAARFAKDRARAVTGVTRDDAAKYCAARGGRLPTDEEWTVAAGSPSTVASGTPSARRYPWGDTGAVCRRAAWGLATGPCATDGTGPDTVGAHADGATDRGIFDLAGNAAEWVAAGPDPKKGVARGGSWRTALATELRTWQSLELDPSAKDDRVGARCAYDP